MKILAPFLLLFFTLSITSRAQQTLNLVVPTGHGDAIEAVALSPNNKLVGSVGLDNALIIWEVESGKVLRTIALDSAIIQKGIYGRRWQLYFSSDSRMVGLTGIGNKRQFRVWDAASGELVFKGEGELISFTRDNIVYSHSRGWQYPYVVYSESAKGAKTILLNHIADDPLWTKYRLTTYVLARDTTGLVSFIDAGTRKVVPLVQVSALEKHRFTFVDRYGYALIAENGGSIHVYHHEKGLLTALAGDYISTGVIQLSTDGKYLKAHCLDKPRVWNLETLQPLNDFSKVVFNSGSTVTEAHDNFEVEESGQGKIIVRDKIAGKQLELKFTSHKHFDGGARILGYNDSDITIVDTRNAAIASEFKSIHQRPVTSLRFDETSSMLFCANGELNIIDFTQSKVQATGYPATTIVPTENNILVTGSYTARKVMLYDYKAQQVVASLNAAIEGNLQATKDRSYIAWSAGRKTDRITLIKRLEGTDSYSMPRQEDINYPASFKLTADGDLITIDKTGTIHFDTDTEVKQFSPIADELLGKMPRRSTIDAIVNNYASFGLLVGSDTSTLVRIDKGEIREIVATSAGLKPNKNITISDDGTFVAFCETGNDNTAVVAERTGNTIKVRHRLRGHLDAIVAISISPDNRLLATSSDDHTIKLWRTNDGQLLSTVRLLPNKEWAVYTPDGIFDASAGAMQMMYFVQGLETIDLVQLKDRFYEPNLLKKLLSDAEALNRNMQDLSKLDLYPEVTGSVDELKGILTIKAVNRGGGIGKIQVIVNSKEFYADARELVGKSLQQVQDMPQITVTIDLSKNKHVLWGERNYIGIKSSNKQSYLVSKTAKIIYDAPKRDVIIANHKPSLYGIVVGTSDYENDDLDLKYASKDAEDFAMALEIAGPNLFEGRVYIKRFTSNGTDRPSKQNLLNAFQDVAAKAKPTDVLVIYFSGHGTNTSGQDSEFLYLTQEASTFNFSDPVIRKRGSISSSEITELLKSIAAQKQVMIIDACASGTVVENLMAKRDIPSETLKALDRMKDRVGTYIMTGCASDAVSYEASKFGQGLLTYSVLSAIRGAALRDEKFIDVLKMFQYCREEVPRLAENIGGIQEPKVFSPYGGDSFDIGLLSSSAEKERIPLATPKPFFLRSNFQDEASFRDNLALGKKLDSKLSDVASRGQESQLVFLDVSEFPGAYSLTGRYKTTENNLKVDLKLFKGETEIRNFQIEGLKTELDALVEKLILELDGVISHLE